MGGSESRRDQSFRPTEWQEAHDVQIPRESEGQYTIVRNRITGQLLDRYTLQFPNEQQYNKYLESISYRRNEPNIIRVMHYEPKIVKQFCGSAYILNVYLQHCKSRLSEYQDIPYPDYLYCAMSMLDGYKKLYDKIGRFYVSEQQVMIDQDGEVRVWLNSDYAQNQAQDFGNGDLGAGNPNQQEYEMVKDIMGMVFDNSDESEGPGVKFVDYFERERNNYHHSVGFQQAKNITHDYMKMNHIENLDIFKSVFEIYQAQIQKNNDALSFKNQLFQHDGSDQRISKVGAGNSFDQRGSVGASQSGRNFAVGSSNGGGFYGENSTSNRNFNSAIPTTFVNTVVSHLPPQPQPLPQPQLQPQIHPGMIVHHNHNQPRHISPPPIQQTQQFVQRPFFPATPVARPQPVFSQYQPRPQPQPQPQLIQQQGPIRQQGFPIVIRPNQISNSVPIIRNTPQPQSQQQTPVKNTQILQNVQSQSSIQPINVLQQAFMQPRGLFNNNGPQVPQIQGNSFQNNLFGDLASGLPKATLQKQSSSKQQQRKQAQNTRTKLQTQDYDHQQNQQQIQKKILKENNYNQDINQANIIRDLSQLHKIQEEEKSKKSGQGDTSRNYHDYSDRKYNEHDHQHERQDDEDQHNGDQHGHEEKGKNIKNILAEDYNIEEMFHEEQENDYNVKKSQTVNTQKQNGYQVGTNMNAQDQGQGQGRAFAFGSQQQQQQWQQQQQNQQAFVFQQQQQQHRFPMRQISQPQYYSGFNPHQLTQFNSLQLHSTQPQQPQVSQTNIIQNQINQMSKQQQQYSYQNQESSASSGASGFVGGFMPIGGLGGAAMGGSKGKKQTYYTLSSQIQLDAEIAADLVMFAA